MALTLKFIEEQFNVINKKHFDGKLLTPRFEITHVKSYLGQYHWRYSYDERIFWDSVIRISDMFDRTDEDIINTIAHEMVHLYIRQNKLRDTRPHHGRVFKSVAHRLNVEGGFHIATTDSVAGCGLRDKTSTNEYIVVNFYSARLGKYFEFVINQKSLKYYLDKIEMYPKHFENAIIFKSTDDKKYAHYPKCHKAIRGFSITKNEYLNNSKNTLYRFATLSAA